MSETNKKIKDRLFVKIFGSEGMKRNTLSLFNALNGTSYDNPDDVQIVTLEDVVYMGLRNDVSFIICDVLNLYEHQSTWNPNMPLRALNYLSEQYKGYIKANKLDMFSSVVQKIPAPRLYTFYNGRKDEPDEQVLELKDMFIRDIEADVSLRVHVLNINYNHNADLMEKCRPLHDYAKFIQSVRAFYRGGMVLSDAVHYAIEQLSPGEIRDYLERHEAEVGDMSYLTEFDEEEYKDRLIQQNKQGWIEEGKGQLNELYKKLIAENKMDELNRCFDDEDYRNKLLSEISPRRVR